MALLPRGAALDRSAFHNEAQVAVALQQQGQRSGVYSELQGPQGAAQLQQVVQGVSAATSAPALEQAQAANDFAADSVARLKLHAAVLNPEALPGHRALAELAAARGLIPTNT